MPTITKVAVANRGEIAKRILSTCGEMGLKTVLLYAAEDTNNQAFHLADETICIGPANPLRSYLNIDANINGALKARAEALHPGYGFLSEDPDFALQCESKGLVFIGPSSQAISLYGDKIKARKIAEKAGISVLPSEVGDVKNPQALFKKAKKLSYPVMIKSSKGRGGRGLKLIHSEQEFKRILPMMELEVLQNSKRTEILLEKYLDLAKHIEVQFFVSAKGEFFVLGDRDCSSQRRYQKIIEEAPSGLPKHLKKQIQEACFGLDLEKHYQGVGTVEFLVQGGNFYFLEINTRLQVEHTVTEMIYGVDLLKVQILTAMDKPVFVRKKNPQPRGHSIQCRIYSESPFRDFLPAAGRILNCHWPYGKSIRVDTAFHTGSEISSLYDSLIAKIIVWEDSRAEAINKMKAALEETIVFGLPTNIEFLKFLLSHSKFVNYQMGINSVRRIQSSDWKPTAFPFSDEFMQGILKELKNMNRIPISQGLSFNPWSDFKKE